MKNIILCLAACIVANLSFAQKHEGKPHKEKDEMGHREGLLPLRELNLSDGQKADMKQKNEAFKQKMKALNDKEDITVKQQRDERALIMKKHRTELESMLTPEQKSKMESLKESARKKRQEMGARKLEDLKQSLNLTEEQAAKIKAGHTATAAKMEAILKNETLDRTAKKQQLEALKKSTKTRMDNILTPEQRTRFDSIRGQRERGPKEKMGERRHQRPPAPMQ